LGNSSPCLVARDFSLPAEWLNSGPTGLLEFGLPDGFADRLQRRDYGEGLVVYLASRYDQIHFKLYAAVDQVLRGALESFGVTDVDL
jgi:hypothetical protein